MLVGFLAFEVGLAGINVSFSIVVIVILRYVFGHDITASAFHSISRQPPDFLTMITRHPAAEAM